MTGAAWLLAALLIVALALIALGVDDGRDARRPRAACDPVAEARAHASALRADCRHDIPGGTR